MRLANLAAAFFVFSAGLASIGAAQAQDYSEPATYGDYEISAAGQSHQIEIVAGGETDASELGGECYGQIATAPDAQLTFEFSGAPLTYEVQSDFDSTLVINTATGDWLCDDDSGGDLNALVEIADPTSGTYDIWIGAYEEDENYSSATLTISHGAPGRRVTIDLNSDDFDTYLVLTSPSGAVQENDDTGSLYHSQIVTDLSDTGTYRVQVTSYAAGDTGAYRLSIVQSEALAAAPGQARRDTVELALGQSVSGSLQNSDSEYEPNRYQDLYSFSGSAGQHVRVDLSGDFDTYLLVRGPGGEEFANDDYEGSFTRSLVEVTLPQTGRYQVIATSYGAETVGAYDLVASFLDSAPASITPNIVDEGSTIYGIFAGISDYSQLRETNPDWGDLSYTADDAIVARDALIASAGMRAENAYTFTYRQATLGNIEGAFDEIAAQINPDDVFVFFYSGHGGQEERAGGPNAADADSYDETLALSDQTVTDDEIDALFDKINAAASIIILDSCYSGGFAKDVVSSPGRMGLFSSDEDVPSLVAGKFQAGGYLSFFFKEAVEDGRADENGDNAINAMELSQYLHVRYSEEAMTKGPSRFDTPHFGYQHLVVDRGGVSHDAILFNLN